MSLKWILNKTKKKTNKRKKRKQLSPSFWLKAQTLLSPFLSSRPGPTCGPANQARRACLPSPLLRLTSRPHLLSLLVSLTRGPRLAAGASFFHLPCSRRTLVGGNRSLPNPANTGICLPSVSTTPNKSRGSTPRHPFTPNSCNLCPSRRLPRVSGSRRG